MESGPYTVEVGATTQGSEVIARNVSWTDALELADSRMNLSGGNWKTPYQTSNGQHFFKMDEHETQIKDNIPYVFITSMPGFSSGGHH